MGYCYEVVLAMDETEDGDCTFLVTVPALPEVTTFGDSQEEAVRNGLDAIEEALAGRINHGEDIPLPKSNPEPKGHFVELPKTVLFKCVLYMLCRQQGITRAELQRKLNLPHREQVDRLFRLDHNTKLDPLSEALEAVGASIKVVLPDDLAA